MTFGSKYATCRSRNVTCRSKYVTYRSKCVTRGLGASAVSKGAAAMIFLIIVTFRYLFAQPRSRVLCIALVSAV